MFSLTPCKLHNKSAIIQLSDVIRIRWVFIVFDISYFKIADVVFLNNCRGYMFMMYTRALFL